MGECNRERKLRPRRRLLITVSTFALLSSTIGDRKALADAQDTRAWLTLGGGWTEYISHDDTEWFTPGQATGAINPGTFTSGPLNGWDGNAKIAFEPAGVDWIFSGAVEYGRSIDRKRPYQETFQSLYKGQLIQASVSGIAWHRENHVIVDFQAGKDFGLGMFGTEGSSIVSAGVRGVRFGAQTFMLGSAYYYAVGASRVGRTFVGIGPEISWDASAPLDGDKETSLLSFDWDAHGGILFGRQTTAFLAPYDQKYQPNDTQRRKAVTVPNFGGDAALSWRLPGLNGKASFGLRADAFLGVLDGGYNTPRKINRIFLGPFISVGIEAD